MRIPRFLRTDQRSLESVDWAATRLRTVGEPAEILRFPINASAEKGISARAELRTRRFAGFTGPEEERYEARFSAAGSSPVELLRSLTAMLEGAADMQQQSNPDAPMVIDIRLIAGQV